MRMPQWPMLPMSTTENLCVASACWATRRVALSLWVVGRCNESKMPLKRGENGARPGRRDHWVFVDSRCAIALARRPPCLQVCRATAGKRKSLNAAPRYRPTAHGRTDLRLGFLYDVQLRFETAVVHTTYKSWDRGKNRHQLEGGLGSRKLCSRHLRSQPEASFTMYY